MDDWFSVENADFIWDFIENGVDSSNFKIQASYENVLFETGTPFVGDILPPFARTAYPEVSNILMAAEADFNRATLVTINGTFFPSIQNLNF